ncbi:MAG: insulinase family protein [Clostridia bacterium]|nr:insulinase family protein [Clostridia bacterium]
MIRELYLDSGVKLVMEKLEHVQSVSLGFWVKTGAVDEDQFYAGISHFVEHMMFKGTDKRSAKEIAEDADKIGGNINAFTGKEATCYYIKTLDSTWKEAGEIIIDMLENSRFDQEELDKERQVICEEIKMTEDTPDELAMDTIGEIIFDGHPFGHSVIGTPENLNRIDHKVMSDYVKATYTRDSIVIVIAGNFDEDEAIEYFNDKLLKLDETKDPRVLEEAPFERKTKVIVKDIEQSHLCLATRACSLYGPLYYELTLLSNIFGGSMSSRLFQSIREQKGLAYTVMSMKCSYASDGFFNIYAGVAHNKIQDAIDGIKEELLKLKDEGITEEELEMAKVQAKASYIFGMENVSSRMFSIGKKELFLGHDISGEEIVQMIDAVNMDGINKAIEMVSNIDEYCACLVTNSEIDLEEMIWK